MRESGYASFAFPVEIYLKSKEEPRKLEILYDLSLNTNGPIRTSQREKRFFNNPSEEFRRKLIRGGGVSSLPLPVVLILKLNVQVELKNMSNLKKAMQPLSPDALTTFLALLYEPLERDPPIREWGLLCAGILFNTFSAVKHVPEMLNCKCYIFTYL